MRRIVPWIMALVACGEAPCEVADCAAVCADLDLPVASQEGGYAWVDAWRVDVIRSELDDLRAGASVDAGGTGLCGGAEGACRGFARSEQDPSLPSGPHRLQLAYRTPRMAADGDWMWSFLSLCLAEGQPLRREAGSGPLPSTAGETRRIDVGVIGHGVDEGACAWTLEVRGQSQRMELEGGAMLGVRPAAEAEAPPAPPDGDPTPSDAPSGDLTAPG